MIKRIYGILDDAHFAAFCERAHTEGLSLGDAISGIAKLYAMGGDCVLHFDKTTKKPIVNQYLRDHAEVAR